MRPNWQSNQTSETIILSLFERRDVQHLLFCVESPLFFYCYSYRIVFSFLFFVLVAIACCYVWSDRCFVTITTFMSGFFFSPSICLPVFITSFSRIDRTMNYRQPNAARQFPLCTAGPPCRSLRTTC